MNFRTCIALSLTLLAAGCNSPSQGRTDAVGVVQPGEESATDPPDPLACQVDEDCVSGPAVNRNDPCCDTGMHVGVYSRRYVAWRRSWMPSHCADSNCPILPSLAQPLPCATEGRCVEGQCQNRCPATAR